MTKIDGITNGVLHAHKVEDTTQEPKITDTVAQEIRMTYLHYRKLGAGGGDTFFDGKAQGIAETLAFLGIEIPWVNAEERPEVDES